MHWYHPEWTADRLASFARLVVAEQTGPVAVRQAFAALPLDHQQWALQTISRGRLPLMCASAFTVPVLSPEACRYIVERSNGYQWEENREEGEAVRIPEVVLSEKDADLGNDVLAVLMRALGPWFCMIWHKMPTTLRSLQLARYNPDDRAGGNFHFDRDSSMTAVISLDPTAFVGGGTRIADGVFGAVELHPLPIGHALVFNGRQTLHEGLPVLSGDRRLLVIWANDDPPAMIP